MMLCTFVSALIALLLFGLATDRHHERRFARRCPARVARRMRGAGWAMLALTMTAAIAGWGPVYGPIAATGTLMLAAGAVCLGLNLIPEVRRPAAASGRDRQFANPIVRAHVVQPGDDQHIVAGPQRAHG